MAGTMRSRHLVDLRNVYDPADVERAGLSYRGVGRGEQRG
jgi:UDPglucose 6-dehydrogenase